MEIEKDLGPLIENYIKEGYKKDLIDNEIVFSRFWLSNFPSGNWEKRLISGNAPVQNQRVLASNLIKSPYGEYTHWAELDGIHYSFNVLKSQKLSDEMRSIVNVLSSLSEKYEDDDKVDKDLKFRFKKLRISFFECLYSRQFKFYDLDLYNAVAKEMIDNLLQVERITKENGRAVLFRTFDSIGFEARDYEDAKRILDIVNENVRFKMHMKYYEKMIHFANYMAYKDTTGFEFTKKLNYNSEIPQMEEIKEKITILLLHSKYKEAYELASNTPLLPDPKGKLKEDRFRRSYVKLLINHFPRVRRILPKEAGVSNGT
ncbi:MAG: hypothetical protein QW478_10110 [Candidatus Micrarchaeaceae archaeon]